jgi:hypothetical protein
LTFRSKIFGNVDFNGLRGDAGLGFFRLIAHVAIEVYSTPPEGEVAITHLAGELSVNGQYLGRVHRHGIGSAIATYNYGRQEQIEFEIELDPRRIEAIEAIRVGRDLVFGLRLRCLVGSGESSNEEPKNEEIEYRANQSNWIEILDQMKYRRTILVEIPTPKASSPRQRIISESLKPTCCMGTSEKRLAPAETPWSRCHQSWEA